MSEGLKGASHDTNNLTVLVFNFTIKKTGLPSGKPYTRFISSYRRHSAFQPLQNSDLLLIKKRGTPLIGIGPF